MFWKSSSESELGVSKSKRTLTHVWLINPWLRCQLCKECSNGVRYRNFRSISLLPCIIFLYPPQSDVTLTPQPKSPSALSKFSDLSLYSPPGELTPGQRLQRAFTQGTSPALLFCLPGAALNLNPVLLQRHSWGLPIHDFLPTPNWPHLLPWSPYLPYGGSYNT